MFHWGQNTLIQDEEEPARATWSRGFWHSASWNLEGGEGRNGYSASLSLPWSSPIPLVLLLQHNLLAPQTSNGHSCYSKSSLFFWKAVAWW